MTRSAPPIEPATAPIRGIVHLVGAGPGDPDLLTVRAARLLTTADVVLHDDLVPPAILALACQALLINVGKRCGRKSITQEQIHSMLVDLARRGLNVVRLQSGDPLLFGRAGEEIEALTAAGIPFSIVPGITAAFAAAAAAGASLTDRRTASSITVSSGHHAADEPNHTAAHAPTRVIYMPGRDLARPAAQLRAEGFPPTTPCVIVSRASRPDQQVQRSTLSDLPELIPGDAPAILLAGAVFAEQKDGAVLNDPLASLAAIRAAADPF